VSTIGTHLQAMASQPAYHSWMSERNLDHKENEGTRAVEVALIFVAANGDAGLAVSEFRDVSANLSTMYPPSSHLSQNSTNQGDRSPSMTAATVDRR
jgi:hypothetical protein